MKSTVNASHWIALLVLVALCAPVTAYWIGSAVANVDAGDVQSVTVVDAKHGGSTLGTCRILIASPKSDGRDYVVASGMNCRSIHIPDDLRSVYFRLLKGRQIEECWGVEEHEGSLIADVRDCQ